MSEEIAAGTEAETELVFKPKPAVTASSVAITALFLCISIFQIVRNWPNVFSLPAFILWFLVVATTFLGFWRYEVRISASTISVSSIWGKRVVPLSAVRGISTAWGRKLTIVYEDQGRIRKLNADCNQFSPSEWERLREAVRHLNAALQTE